MPYGKGSTCEVSGALKNLDLAIRKFLVDELGKLENRRKGGLDRGDIHLVAPRFVDKIEASADISGGCHRLDADRLSECSFLGKLQSSNCMVLGMAFRCVLAARKEIDLAWTFHDSEPDRASAPICPWTVVDDRRLHRLTGLLVHHS